MDTLSSFDIGPLTWVKGEIDVALDSASASLEGWNGSDTLPLREAATYLHQVAGALQIVDLQGVYQVCNAVEGLLADMQAKEEKRTAESAKVARDAIAALRSYLEGLMAGNPNNELRLNEPYAAVLSQRGIEPPSPSDLFRPDLSARMARPSSDSGLDDESLKSAIRTIRTQYQRGLRDFLLNKEPEAGLHRMNQALQEMERVVPGSALYTFWWAAGGVIDALIHGRIEPDIWLKRMLGRIDLQMRRLGEGSRQLADRLFRDVLFFLSHDMSPSGRGAEACELFELECYRMDAARAEKEREAEVLRPKLAALRDAVGAAKDHWMSLCAGRNDNLMPLREDAREANTAAQGMPDGALAELTQAVLEAAERTASSDAAVANEALQMEMATALLLIQHGASNYFNLGRDFPSLATIQAGRLSAVVSGEMLEQGPGVPLLDEIARQAQEKLLLTQVTREIQANLHRVEEILDKFFRNRLDRAGLPMVPGLLKQIQGALSMLQLDVATQLVEASLEHIDRVAGMEGEIEAEELHWIAEALSMLGMYVDDLRHGRDETTGMRALLSPPEEAAPQEATVETVLEENTARLRETSSQLAEAPDQVEKREELRRELTRIAADAELVGNRSMGDQAGAAIKLIEQNAPIEAIQDALRALSGPVPEAPTVEAEPPASEQEIDAELLAIYIEEAKDVLASIFAHLASLRGPNQEHDAFVDIRRGFHTLKGSGRMVGLTDLAEVAWEAEQTFNLWLREERPVTRAVLDFAEQVAHAFQGWVTELESQGSVSVVADAIVGLARTLRGEAEAPVPQPVETAAPEAAEAPAAETLEASVPETPEVPEPPDLQELPELQEVSEIPEAPAAPELPAVPEFETVAEMTLPEEPSVPAGIEEPAPSAEPEPELEEQPESDTIAIGQHQVPAPLLAIFEEESASRLAEMRSHLADMSALADSSHWEGFARSAHTLAGIARTTGITPLADAAHAIELWAQGWPAEARPLAVSLVGEIAVLLNRIADQLQQIQARSWPDDLTDLLEHLVQLKPHLAASAPEEEVQALPPEPAMAEVPVEAEAPVEVELPEPVSEPVPVQVIEEAVVAEPEEAEPIDDQLLPIFLAEADELLPRIGESLRQWRTDPSSGDPCQALQRALHTLKGSARMAGAMKLGDRTHEMETRIVELGDAPPQAAFLDQLELNYDEIAELVDRLRPSSPRPAAVERAAPVLQSVAGPEEGEIDVRQAFKAKANVLDSLINEAGEISVARARIESVMGHYKLTAQELTANVERLRSQLRELEIQAEAQIGTRLSRTDDGHFDPLEFDRFTRLQELTRLMAESVNDVSTAQENLLADLSDVDYALLQQSRTARNLQHELMQIRMVRLNSQSERLHRIVRQAAKELHRHARLHIEGGDIELDRTVLDKAMAPFEHLLRNAVAHGIEDPDVRQSAGKSEYGQINLVARQEGTDVVLTLTDDGGGIRLDKIRARAESLGWIKSGDDVERERLESFLFLPGFSTTDAVTQVAGRGVGLDVVRSEIASVGGRVRVESEAGQWTRFTIRLPATLALSQVVLVSAGDQIYAIPSAMVVLVKEMKEAEWEKTMAEAMVDLDGQVFPLHSLAELTGQEPSPYDGHTRTVILLRSGDERVALRVDHLKGNTEAVLKAIGPQLARVPGVAGATVLADGRVTLILNPFALVEQAPAAAMRVVSGGAAEDRPPMILVVDDSLTVRKITGRLLVREGYRVVTAKDGAEALELLEDELPAVMLLDIEMPRMDGFEVARHVRATQRTKDIPIIMITSRTADKHREHARALGVNDYMGKPYKEDELLAAIDGFVKKSS